jgi:Flp pilus assembly protein TadG
MIMQAPIGSNRSRKGAAMTEFALILPVLALLLVLCVDFCRLFYHDQTIINCARNGAAYASDPASPLRNRYADFRAAALADAPDLDPPLTAADVTSSVSGSDVTVTVNYQFPMMTTYLGFSSVSLSKSVTMRMAQVVPD